MSLFNQFFSSSFNFIKIVAITWKDAPENQFPILGSDFKVRCEVTASPAPVVDWLRNGDLVCVFNHNNNNKMVN